MFDAGVYVVRFPDRAKASLAIRPRVVSDGMVVTWHDTTRHRRFRASVEEGHEGVFVILTDDGRRIGLEPLTRATFAAELGDRFPGVPVQGSDAALREYYLERF